MTEIAYKLNIRGVVSYVSQETYCKMFEVYKSGGYEIQEVTELPIHEKIMQRRDSDGIYTFTTIDTLRALRGIGNPRVGDVAKVNNGMRDILLKAVEVTGIRVVWEKTQ
jgi:hypothetical protein